MALGTMWFSARFSAHLDEFKVLGNTERSLEEGVLLPLRHFRRGWWRLMFEALAKKYSFRLDTPWDKLSKKIHQLILYGTKGEEVHLRYQRHDGKTSWEQRREFEGVIPYLERRYQESDSDSFKSWLTGFMSSVPCPSCTGQRLRKESLSVLFGGLSISELCSKSIEEVFRFFQNVPLDRQEKSIATALLREIRSRLGFLVDVGLSYLTLKRSAGSLSGGEAQRIRLASQIGSGLVGVMYVLDEPTIGLHQKDNERLLRSLLALRNLGNTLIVVEHDEETILTADHVIDMGPGAGEKGGFVIAEGPPKEIKKNPRSLTGKYLSGNLSIPLPPERRRNSQNVIVLEGARENNLKNITVKFPLGMFIAITGVSGSGKSTLIVDTLLPVLLRELGLAHERPGNYKKIYGVAHVQKVIAIDQSPIGRTPRSNPATYTGLFTPIRELFSSLPESRRRGYAPGRFSFNVRGGRCEKCEGTGVKLIEMHFLPDVYITCEECQGRRFNEATLEIKYKGKNIADILDLSCSSAFDVFSVFPSIKSKLETLNKVGLGYIRLGQSATTLSGGEAQRIKLSTELSRVPRGHTVYLLDEPTTGLHFDDVRKLIFVLQELVSRGHTVIVIEHNLHLIKCADHIIDLGPEGGEKGGRILSTGTPEEISEDRRSYTGQYLKKLFLSRPRNKKAS